MLIPNKSLKSGFSMPILGKGNWMTNVGKKPKAKIDDYLHTDEIAQAVTAGITYFDTAERYGNGRGESFMGEVLQRSDRENQFLVSKVSSEHLGYDDVIFAAKSSLKKMQLSYLDLYLIHQYNTEISLKETMRAMDVLIENKIVKNIGVCNFTVAQLQEAQSYTKNKIVVNQLHYNIMHRDLEKTNVIAYCQKNDIMIVAWRPFEQFLLSKKLKTVLEDIGNKYKKSSEQIAYIWLLSQVNIVILSKFNKLKRLQDAISVLEAHIDSDDMIELNKEYS